jgi:uncharacterized membrane protein
MKRLVALVVLTCPFLLAQDWNDPVKPVNTATPQQQLAGDLLQILNSNYQAGAVAYGQPNNVLGQADAGVWGMDEGACTLFPDNRIFCIYGDTITTFWDATRSHWDDYQFANSCPSKGGVSGGSGSCLGLKAMSLIPATGGNPADPSACNAIAGVDAGLTAGQTPTINYSGCWTPVYITNSSHLAGSQPAMASQTISGITTNADGIAESILAGHTPNTAFVVGGNLYIEWNVTREGQSVVGKGGYQTETILMKCGPTSAITSVLSAELPCFKSYVRSQAPKVIQGTASVMTGSSTVTATSGAFASYMTTAAGNGTGAYQLIWVDANNQQEYTITGYSDSTHITVSPAYMGTSGSVGWNVMQHQETNIGKFVSSTTSVFATAGLPWLSQLPAALQSATNIVCTWGSSWAWRQSNLYLMCMDAADIDSATYTYNSSRVNGSSGGLQQAYYLTGLSNGVPSWTLDATNGAENQAIALLTTFAHECVSKFPGGGTGVAGAGSPEVCFNIGKPSVRYSPALQRFVLTYGSAETQGLVIRTSRTPWGPWSTEQDLLPSGGTESWDSKMVAPTNGGYGFNLTLPHNAPVACAGCTHGIATNVMYLATNPTQQVTASYFSQLGGGGNWYAPYQYPVEHRFGDGTVGLYFHTSAFNPYVTFDFSVIMGAANFTISASPSSLSIAQGNQGTSTITTTVSGGFNSAVTLSASGLPSGAGVSFNTNPIPAPGNGSSTMTITVNKATAPGTYPITITGDSGGVQQTTTVTLTVTAGANFTISASPASLSIAQGHQGTSTITTAISAGFNSAITLSASGLPSQTTVSFSRNPIPAPGNGSSTMTITVGSSTPPGTYPITVAGNGGGIQQNTTVTLTVTAGANNFTISASPASLSIQQGKPGTSTITTAISGGFNGAITLSASGLPSQTTVSFSRNPIPAPGNGSSTLTITVGSSTPTGTYPITVAGNGGGIQQTATVTLTVTAGANFTISASPASLSIQQGKPGTSTITTAISGGFNSAITLSASGVPSGTSVSFSPNPIPAPGGGSSTMTITVGSSTPTGTYPITVTGNGGGIQQNTTVTLTVTGGANFTISASPASLSIQQGKPGTSTITTAISGGFNNAITLSVSGVPSGANVSFSPNPIPAPGNGSSTMTITVGSSTPTGTYPITVTGNGGGIQQNTTVTLTVTGGANFAISASPSSLHIKQGDQGTSTITTAISGGFNNAITLLASGVPSGTSVSFSPNPIPAPGNGSSTMTITVGSSTPTGTYPITVTGNGGGIQQNTTVTLTVQKSQNQNGG